MCYILYAQTVTTLKVDWLDHLNIIIFLYITLLHISMGLRLAMFKTVEYIHKCCYVMYFIFD